MPDASHVAVFPARRDAFVRLRTFVEEACAGAGVPHGEGLRLMLLIEELFVNTVEHGHGGDSDAPVQLALTLTEAIIAVEYEDTAREFDPLASAPTPSEAPDVADRPIGGLGIVLVTTMADDVAYARRDGRNRITFRVRRGR
jgi:anti-sigma regulatory factor (Ser/Thr protein kinase)